MMADHSNQVCRKHASAYELLINFELQLWDRRLLKKHQDSLLADGHTNLEPNMQVCKSVVATAAWIS